MSAAPGQDAPPLPSKPQGRPKSQRVLACVLCQQRKIKCDRRFPCANCVKNQAQCIPATQARRRKRRFPERELLDRLHQYEDLLRRNNVKFEALHGDRTIGEKESPEDFEESDEEQANAGAADEPSPSVTVKSEGTYEAKSLWQVMGQVAPGSNNDGESPVPIMLENTVKMAWDQLADDDHILFGSRQTVVDLSTFHPEPVDIFRHWQLYLDNVNPLLKVTHTPSLQGRIIEAAGNVMNVPPDLEALMFSIYSMSTASLDDGSCHAMFGMSKDDLLTKYQFGCQQALINAGFLRTVDRDCLTALYLHLLSVRSGASPRSLSSMFGVVMRIAQCMGIHNESSLAKCSVFEAEMRRRLWWSIMLYDTRRSEMADHKDSSLSPIWDCRVPVNVNDSDLRVDMKEQPVSQSKPTEAFFVVCRCVVSDFVRHTPAHLDFTNPALKPIVRELPDGGSFAALETRIEREYLQFADSESPIHFMTIWTTRAYLSKNRLLEHYSKIISSDTEQLDEERDFGTSLSLRIIECDIMLMKSSLSKGYRWFLQSYFPFPAYLHIVQDLRRRPLNKQADRAWEVLTTSYGARFPTGPGPTPNPLIRMFDRTMLSAWEAVEAAWTSEAPLQPPGIIVAIKQRQAQSAQAAQNFDTTEPGGVGNMDVDSLLRSMPILGDDDATLGMGGHDGFAGAGPMDYGGQGQGPFNFGGSQLNWPPMRWYQE